MVTKIPIVTAWVTVFKQSYCEGGVIRYQSHRLSMKAEICDVNHINREKRITVLGPFWCTMKEEWENVNHKKGGTTLCARSILMYYERGAPWCQSYKEGGTTPCARSILNYYKGGATWCQSYIEGGTCPCAKSILMCHLMFFLFLSDGIL